MRAMPDDELERLRSTSRRDEIERQLSVFKTRARALAQRHGRLAGGIALGVAAGIGAGLLIARRRQRSVMGRMQSVVPSNVWELPEELLGQLKKPLRRAAKAL